MLHVEVTIVCYSGICTRVTVNNIALDQLQIADT